MLKKRTIWALTIAFLFPIYSYADSTTVPDFNSSQECQTWVLEYAYKVELKTRYDMNFFSWLGHFYIDPDETITICENEACTIYTTYYNGGSGGPEGGGCGMVGLDGWVIAKRNLVDQISLYESKLELLPAYSYGTECRYPEGTCQMMMYTATQPCATLNALNSRLHIPCLNVDGKLDWIEADLVVNWTFDLSNIGAGFYVPGHKDDCATYTASTRIVHIPCVNIGTKSYWADFEVMNTDPIQLRLKAYGAN